MGWMPRIGAEKKKEDILNRSLDIDLQVDDALLESD